MKGMLAAQDVFQQVSTSFSFSQDQLDIIYFASQIFFSGVVITDHDMIGTCLAPCHVPVYAHCVCGWGEQNRCQLLCCWVSVDMARLCCWVE